MVLRRAHGGSSLVSSSMLKFTTRFLLPASTFCYLTHTGRLWWPSVRGRAMNGFSRGGGGGRRGSAVPNRLMLPFLLHVLPPATVASHGLLGLRCKGGSAKNKGSPDFANINSMQTDDAAAYVAKGPKRWTPAFNFQDHVEQAWQHWRDLGSPRFMMAPMVDQSELAFRELGRKYGCDLCYTPMLHSKMFTTAANYRKDYFQTAESDRPLVVQFCANNPSTLLEAAKYVENDCDAVDINLGCPQGIAKKGKYGAFLMEDWDRIHDMVLTLKEELKVPVWAKVRVFPDLARTLEYVKMIEAAGASAIAVHGRTREQRGNNPGPPDWEAIRAVKEAVHVPVIANGGVSSRADAEACLAATGCDAVMSACGLLETPTLFAGETREPVDIAAEYLAVADRWRTRPKEVQPHLFCMLRPLIAHRPDLLASLSSFRHSAGNATAVYQPFLQLLTRQVGTLEDAKLAQSLPAPTDLNETHLDELVSLGVSREMSRSAYKAWQRKQRQKLKKQMGSGVEVFQGGAGEVVGKSEDEGMDPFHACSLYYHVLGEKDRYGEATLKAALEEAKEARRRGDTSGKGVGRFLVRKSNSEPLSCITVSYVGEDAEVYHLKVQRTAVVDRFGDGWRLKWEEDDGSEWEKEDADLDKLLRLALIPKGIHGLVPTPAGTATSQRDVEETADSVQS